MFGKKVMSVTLAMMFVLSMAVVGLGVADYAPNASATTGEDVSQMIEDLTPSFSLLVFVMVFVIMLMTIVDRIGKR